MGNSYCLSPDKKAVQNELTVINIQEENLEEKNYKQHQIKMRIPLLIKKIIRMRLIQT